MTDEHVFAFASGKGGVGKTTTAVNVATAIAGGGYRVAVVDADLGMANMSGLLSLDPGDATLHDVLADEAAVPEATYEVARGIFAVPSGEELDTYAKTDARGLGDVLEELRGRFDYVFMDVGAGISHETVLPLGLADGVVLIATPEPAAVNDVEKTQDLVERADGEVAGLVMTRTRATDSIEPEEVAADLGVELLGTVPEDGAVRGSLYAGVPLVVQNPESKASIGFRRIAARLADKAEAERAAVGYGGGETSGAVPVGPEGEDDDDVETEDVDDVETEDDDAVQSEDADAAADDDRPPTDEDTTDGSDGAVEAGDGEPADAAD